MTTFNKLKGALNMKTFSLRLTDEENEALARIAYLSGVSKNKALQQLIANEYAKIDEGSTEAAEILYLRSMADIADEELDLSEKIDRSKLLKALKYINYSIEYNSAGYCGEDIDILESRKADLLEKLRNL